jgi:hypothetical protein
MTTVVGVAMLLGAPAAFLGFFSIPIYVGAAVLLVVWLNRRTSCQKKTVSTKPTPANHSKGEEKLRLPSKPIQLSGDVPPWAEAYQTITEDFRRQLDEVTSPESARSFVAHAVKQVKAAEATVPEFYAGELYYRFQRKVRDDLKAELATYESEIANIKLATEARSADLEARLETARVADDQEAEHAVWREREQEQTEAHAAGDTLLRRASKWTLRMGAVDDLGRALGGWRKTADKPPRLDWTDEEDNRPSRGPTRSTFWIYEIPVHQFSKIHRASCRFCNHGRGLHDRGTQAVAGTWLGPFESLEDALAAAEATGRLVETCAVCAPS